MVETSDPASPALAGVPAPSVAGRLLGPPVVPRPLTLREHAVETIRRAIITGALQPGERLLEDRLAERLGISRAPVREAIRALEYEGLVRSEPHRASYVVALEEDEIDDLYRIRAEVETLAARRAARAIAGAPEKATPYRQLLERMRRAVAVGDVVEVTVADLELHRLILEHSGYVVMPRVWGAMYGILRARTSLVAERAGDRLTAYTAESHAPLVEALASGDENAAATAVRHHILETRDMWAAVRDAQRPADGEAAPDPPRRKARHGSP
jgi:DNA-binding GntR family transcriptional regulator